MVWRCRQLRSVTPNDDIRLPSLGGTARPHSATLLGEAAENQLGELHVDLALMGTHAITGDLLSETSLEVARVKRAMIKAARRTIVLADNTKFREPAFATICRATDISAVITTHKSDQAAVAALKDSGAEVYLVDGDN
jgi:DeoR family transcriptional regulator, aga operon transcriptional repressor